MHYVRRFLYQSGGVRQAPQQRSERHLTGDEREGIATGIAAGESSRQPARWLGRSASTASREIACGGGRGHSPATPAPRPPTRSPPRGRRPKQAKLARRPLLRALVEAKPIPRLRLAAGRAQTRDVRADGTPPRVPRRT
ncbi:helix-turn-helix domain-containing protein [Streptomyces chattanoogensis]|uniref:helix-turn-helix domain-containing protein n=1 Tax=Streptomyces chattanoogensis TaxID=66876 RepID=UPI0012FF1064|nr:helix-turn-helix domain-containing protein [Streptomyces chattanoogensis]